MSDDKKLHEITQDILLEIGRVPIKINRFRKSSGTGRSQTWGIVNRRCSHPHRYDYSSICWQRPYLYHLLLLLGEHVCTHEWNSICVNMNYECKAHIDKHNVVGSLSTVVAFGDYAGGELELMNGSLKGVYDINLKPLTTIFGNTIHRVLPITSGTRISCVFFLTPTIIPPPPSPSVKFIDNEWRFYRGSICIDKKKGLKTLQQ